MKGGTRLIGIEFIERSIDTCNKALLSILNDNLRTTRLIDGLIVGGSVDVATMDCDIIGSKIA